MLPISRKLDCQKAIQQQITIPARNFLEIKPRSICMYYSFRKRIRLINLKTPKHAAMFFVKHGVISKYKLLENDDVIMYKPGYVIRLLPANERMFMGAFDMREVDVEVAWSDIQITPADIRRYAAVKEYESGGSKMGEEAKVVPIWMPIYNRAA